MSNTTQAPRAAAVDLDTVQRRAEELDYVDSRWTHTGAPYEWDAATIIRALVADLDATRAERDAARATTREWIAANGPGGWIDDLRKSEAAAYAMMMDIERERAALAAALPDPMMLHRAITALERIESDPEIDALWDGLRNAAYAVSATAPAPVPVPVADVPDVPGFLAHRVNGVVA